MGQLQGLSILPLDAFAALGTQNLPMVPPNPNDNLRFGKESGQLLPLSPVVGLTKLSLLLFPREGPAPVLHAPLAEVTGLPLPSLPERALG